MSGAPKRGDAKFIDAIHTNAGMRGKPLPYADVDFYANGGTFQTPCSMFSKYGSRVVNNVSQGYSGITPYHDRYRPSIMYLY